MLFDEYNKLSENWIVEIERIKKKNKDGSVFEEYYEFTAQPVWAYPYLAEKVWNFYDYVIFMSGTILDKNMFSKMNGIDPSQADYISIESPFPVENRPIYYFSKTGKQTFKTKELVWLKQKEVLAKILKQHKKDKGIVHTANYEIQGWVTREFGTERILAHDSTNRADMLQLHYNTDRPTVLVSPSMMTGVDLKDDFSRHQTILKMPYPNLGSKKIKKRMDTMPDWYTLKSVQDLIQMYGRSVRSKDDKAKTYILDSCFSDILKWGGKWIPKWIKDAIQYIE
jgi:Rad3-related DNA helicase